MNAHSRILHAGAVLATFDCARVFVRHHAPTLSALIAGTATATLLGQIVIAHGIAIIALGLLSILVHESGHVVAYRLLAPRDAPATFSCTGYRAVVIRDPLEPWRDVLVTIAGPAAPALLAIATFPLARFALPEYLAWLILSAGHLLGIVVPGADRAALAAAAHASADTRDVE